MQPVNDYYEASSYMTQLERLIKSTTDHLNLTCARPRDWPRTLKHHRLRVGDGASSLMVSQKGEFFVPATIPASVLFRFISESHASARLQLAQYEDHEKNEQRVRDECMVVFGLASMDKDESIHSKKMVQFGERLLARQDQFRPYLKDAHLKVASYYDVHHDGQICVPVDFK